MGTAYFDVDGTLVGSNLLHPALAYLTREATPARSARRLLGLALDGPRLAFAEWRDRRWFNELLFRHFAGLTEDRLVVLADEVFTSALKPRIHPGAQDLVAQCKRAGLRVVLVTGSLDVVVEPLRRHLGADGAIANRLEIVAGEATGRLSPPVVAGPQKARLIAEDAAQAGHDLIDCQGYSDSYSDVPMLSAVGRAFAVHPDPRLRKLADVYGWPVLDLSRPSPGEARTGAAP